MYLLLKGYSTPKWKFCHYSLTRMSFQLHKSFVRLRNTILDENRETCVTRILFVRKENKNNERHFGDYAPNALLYPPQCNDAYSTCIYALIWMTIAHPSFWGGYRRAACARCIISKMVLRWCRETQRRRIVDKKYIFIFFTYKKDSRRFITLRLNHLWQMDYPGDAFHTFLDLVGVIYLAVNGTVTSLPVFYLKYLKLCSEDKQSFYGVGTPCR